MKHTSPALSFFVENNLVSSAISKITESLFVRKEALLKIQLTELPQLAQKPKLAELPQPVQLVKRPKPEPLPTLPEPPKPARIAVVDALRGTALLGIVAVHLRQLFVSGGLPSSVSSNWASGPINDFIIKMVDTFLVNKFYSLFSFLFGLGFTLMLSRQRDKASVFYLRFTRRQLVLGAIGILHYLNWQGDILFVYAMLGLSLILFYQVPNRIILVLAIALTLNLPGNLFWTLTYWDTPMPATHTASDYYLLLHGSYFENILDNLKSFGHYGGVYSIGRIIKTLGFFLFGLYAGRRYVFQNIETKGKLLRWGIVWAVGMLLVTKVISVALTRGSTESQRATELLISLFRVIYNSRDVLVTLLYVAGLTLFFQSRFGQRAAKLMAAAGQMALTNYLFQTFACTLLLCGYGVGLLGHIQVWVAILLSIPLFALQIWLSVKWLAHFKYGPVEWLWRSCTYGKLQPLRR